MENIRLRTLLAVGGLVLGFIWVAPNFLNTEKMWWPTHKKLNYGLDIQGGLHLVMSADVAGVVAEGGQRLAKSLTAEFAREKIEVSEVKPLNNAEHEFEVITNPANQKRVVEHMDSRYATMLQKMNETPDGKLTYRYYEAYLTDYKSKVIQQAIETIRNRIDEFGVAEPSISQQGDNRILIQLPGMADAEKAKQLINTTAKLDFMVVAKNPPANLQQLIEDAEKAGGYKIDTLKYSEYVNRLNKDLADKLPAKTMLLFEKAENAQSLETGRIPVLLQTDTNLGGDALTDAFVTFGQYGSPEVALRFNAAGAGTFKELTTANVGRQMAIVLDKVVKTAPNINTPIGNGEAVIQLGSGRDRNKTMEEAKMISTTLRAGALPAALEQLEERRVGPSLGADSVRKAQMGSYLGAFLIFCFMIFRYRGMGVITDISLALNVFSIFALLSWLGATLTLPGIAGIALTVGFAVDANVLINERMRDELAKGNSINVAIKEGYHRAMSAILDSNATVAAVAGVLLYFGTGPVRGFAVTLLIGIVTTLFANVFVSKVLVDTLVHRFGMKKISV